LGSSDAPLADQRSVADEFMHIQDALAIDFEMAVVSLSDNITVQTGTPLVNATSATVITVVDQPIGG